jgi:hypothetical protein
MILPPFFGFYTKYNEKEINNIICTYINSDLLTYTKPVSKVNITYVGLDLLSYTKKTLKQEAIITFLTSDVLTYSNASTTKKEINITYIGADILCYESPPTVPGIISQIYAREKDSSGIFSWDIPHNGKNNIIDYIVEYKNITENFWTPINDGISSSTGINIQLDNNETYKIRVAAVNSIGTGLFQESPNITPSGGTEQSTELVFYSMMNSSDRNQIADNSCRPKTIRVITNDPLYDNNDGVFNNSWYFTGNLNEEDYPSTYGHMHVENTGIDDSWSLGENFTISVWIKPDNLQNNTNYTILSSASEIDNYNSWKLYCKYNEIIFSINNQNILSATAIDLTSSNYTNIAVCKSKDYISLFVDGIEKSETYYKNSILISSSYLIIGANHDYYYQYNSFNGRGYVTEGFKGNIDEVLFSRSCFYRGGFIPYSGEKTIIC